MTDRMVGLSSTVRQLNEKLLNGLSKSRNMLSRPFYMSRCPRPLSHLGTAANQMVSKRTMSLMENSASSIGQDGICAGTIRIVGRVDELEAYGGVVSHQRHNEPVLAGSRVGLVLPSPVLGTLAMACKSREPRNRELRDSWSTCKSSPPTVLGGMLLYRKSQHCQECMELPRKLERLGQSGYSLAERFCGGPAPMDKSSAQH